MLEGATHARRASTATDRGPRSREGPSRWWSRERFTTTHAPGSDMARKPNYQHEKRQRELERKAKKEEKAQRRQERAAAGETDPDGEGETPDQADAELEAGS